LIAIEPLLHAVPVAAADNTHRSTPSFLHQIDGSMRMAVCAGRMRGLLFALSGGAGELCGDDVGGVPVEGDAGAFVAHGGSRVGV
jgi:hypothetical protein